MARSTTPFRPLAPLICGFALLATAARAEPARVFRLPAEPIDTALVRFGVQAGVSVGGFPVRGCAGRSHGVTGVLTPSEALRRLLPSGCGFQQVDARAFRIVAAQTPSLAPAPDLNALPPTPSELEELVVTAEKRREPLRGSPFAVSAVAGADVERLGAASFAEMALQFPAVAETNLGPGRNKIFIRGISDGAFTGRTQSTVGLYLDDVPITYSAPDPDLRLADVERVEVLRGPQGTLYGAGSIGGIVRIVTARPDPDEVAAAVTIEGMINQYGDRAAGFEAMLNVPLPKGRGAVRGVVYRDGLTGYLDNPVLGLDDVNHGTRSGARLAALVDFGDGWQVRASYGRQAINTADSQYVQGAGRLVRDTRILEPHDNDIILFGATVSRAGAKTDFHMSAAYIDHDLATRYDATGAFDLGGSETAVFDESQGVGLLVAEATLASARPGRVQWLAGVFGSRSAETGVGVLDAASSGGTLRSVFNRHDQVSEAAIFGDVTYDVTPRLTALMGGRLFATRVSTRSNRFDLARPPAGEVRAHRTDDGFAPKMRLSYAFGPQLVVYAQFQDGYRAGGFNVPAHADGVNGGPEVTTYRPDRLRSFEIGGEAGLFDQTLTLRAAVFRASWKNIQTDQFRPSGLPLTLNIGDGANTGTEIELAWRPDTHWRIQANALFNGPELTRSNDVFPARVDIGLPGVAKMTAAVDVSYRWRLSPGLQAELSAQAGYVGRSYLTFDGATATAMGDYGRSRVSATLGGTRWRFQGYIDNVTNASGDTFAFGNPFSSTRSSQATPLPPRNFGLAVRRTF